MGLFNDIYSTEYTAALIAIEKDGVVGCYRMFHDDVVAIVTESGVNPADLDADSSAAKSAAKATSAYAEWLARSQPENIPVEGADGRLV